MRKISSNAILLAGAGVCLIATCGANAVAQDESGGAFAGAESYGSSLKTFADGEGQTLKTKLRTTMRRDVLETDLNQLKLAAIYSVYRSRADVLKKTEPEVGYSDLLCSPQFSYRSATDAAGVMGATAVKISELNKKSELTGLPLLLYALRSNNREERCAGADTDSKECRQAIDANRQTEENHNQLDRMTVDESMCMGPDAAEKKDQFPAIAATCDCYDDVKTASQDYYPNKVLAGSTSEEGALFLLGAIATFWKSVTGAIDKFANVIGSRLENQKIREELVGYLESNESAFDRAANSVGEVIHDRRKEARIAAAHDYIAAICEYYASRDKFRIFIAGEEPHFAPTSEPEPDQHVCRHFNWQAFAYDSEPANTESDPTRQELFSSASSGLDAVLAAATAYDTQFDAPASEITKEYVDGYQKLLAGLKDPRHKAGMLASLWTSSIVLADAANALHTLESELDAADDALDAALAELKQKKKSNNGSGGNGESGAE